MTKQNTLKWILQVMEFVFGLISILGGMAAWRYVSSREPERYLVSAVVMIVGGILWMLPPMASRYNLSKKQIVIVLVTLFLGLTLGLLYTFSACGGECGLGASFCRWERGYPGRWFISGGCYGPVDTPLDFQLTVSRWRIDGISLLADLVFWSAAGLILAFLWQNVSLRKNKSTLKDNWT